MKDLLEMSFEIVERLIFFNERLVSTQCQNIGKDLILERKTFSERLLIFFKLTMSNHCREGLVKTEVLLTIKR